METKTISALFVVLLAVAAGCATLDSARHEYIMRGQILEATDAGVYLCIGSRDGAQVGQELTVYRFVRTSPLNPKVPAPPTFKKEETGKVKITEIVDEHFAKAKLLAGTAEVNYVVELQR